MSNCTPLDLVLQNCIKESPTIDPQLESIIESENPFSKYKKVENAEKKANSDKQQQTSKKRKYFETTNNEPSKAVAPIRHLAPIPKSSQSSNTKFFEQPASRRVVYNSSSKGQKGTRMIVPATTQSTVPGKRRRYFKSSDRPVGSQESTPTVTMESYEVDSGSTTSNLLSHIDRIVETNTAGTPDEGKGGMTKSKENKKKKTKMDIKKNAHSEDDDVICLDDDEESPVLHQELYETAMENSSAYEDDEVIYLSDDKDSEPPALEKMPSNEETSEQYALEDQQSRPRTPIVHFC